MIYYRTNLHEHNLVRFEKETQKKKYEYETVTFLETCIGIKKYHFLSKYRKLH